VQPTRSSGPRTMDVCGIPLPCPFPTPATTVLHARPPKSLWHLVSAVLLWMGTRTSAVCAESRISMDYHVYGWADSHGGELPSRANPKLCQSTKRGQALSVGVTHWEQLISCGRFDIPPQSQLHPIFIFMVLTSDIPFSLEKDR
jgi:hypothetical protein